MKRMFAALLVLFVVASPALAQVPAGCNPPPVERPLDTTPPINLSLLKQSLIYYRCTLYDADIAKVVAEARDWVAQRAPQVAKPAIVLDIDETALSNWAEIYHNDFGFIYGGGCDLNAKTACGVHAWELSARGVAIKPTLELYNLARKLKGKNGSRLAIFFITGRDEATDERAATVRNLRKAGYDGWKKLHLRPRGARRGALGPPLPGDTGGQRVAE